MRGTLIIGDFVRWDSFICERLVSRFCHFKLHIRHISRSNVIRRTGNDPTRTV